MVRAAGDPPTSSRPGPTSSEPKTQQEGAPTAAEPEVVARVGAPVAHVAPRAAQATNQATRSQQAPTAHPQAKATREGRQTALILEPLKRLGGASESDPRVRRIWMDPVNSPGQMGCR